MDRLLLEHREGVLHVRGISDEVIDAEATRYESFSRGEWERFLYLMELEFMLKLKKPVWKGKVAQSGGVVIRRFGVDGATPRPYARLDEPVHMRARGRRTHYLYRPGDKRKHIDVHPLVRERLASGEPLFLCLEGSLKADSVLSSGGLSVSSTSVTTWECRDLTKLLPALRKAQIVFVVPDSDYYASPKYEGSFNPMVRWHTRAACQWLATRNVNATIRVPWLGTSSEKVGVDDYLSRGYPLDGMAHQDAKYAPRPLAHYDLTPSQTSILSWLMESQGPYGAFLPGRVARDVGVERKTVTRAYRRFEELGIMRVWKGKRESTQDGVVQTPHVYQFTEPVDVDYKTWLETLPVPSPRL